MAQTQVALYDKVRDRHLELRLPDDVPLAHLVPALARKLGLPVGEYALTVEGAGAPLLGETTLAGAGVTKGATLRLERVAVEAPSVEAESPATVEALPAESAPPLAMPARPGEPIPQPPEPAPLPLPVHRASLPGWPWVVGCVLLVVVLAIGVMWVNRRAADRAATATSTARAWVEEQAAATSTAEVLGREQAAATAAVRAAATATVQAQSIAQALASSPHRIAFMCSVPDHYMRDDLCVMNADGTELQTILENVVRSVPAWSPDGRHIAFVDALFGESEVYVMDADGSHQENLTNNPSDDRRPAWSLDGQRIAFVSSRDGNEEIYVMEADGSGQTRLTNSPASDDHPVWSPDGRRIAFVSYRDGNYEIYVMNADGSGQANLANNPANDLEPAWSPDGRRIAFTRRGGSNQDGNVDSEDGMEIYIVNADGSGQKRLIKASYASHPAWSPDGRRIAFQGRFSDDAQGGIYTVNVDGTDLQRLADQANWSESPAWSPDGKFVAFVSSSHMFAYEISVASAEGSGQINLTVGRLSHGSLPAWSPAP
jgi:Tol biopolymer transport system component